MTCAILTLYTIASARQIHAIRLFHQAVRDAVPDVQILDWTDLAAPPAGLGPIQRRDWRDTDAAGKSFPSAATPAARAILWFTSARQVRTPGWKSAWPLPSASPSSACAAPTKNRASCCNAPCASGRATSFMPFIALKGWLTASDAWTAVRAGANCPRFARCTRNSHEPCTRKG